MTQPPDPASQMRARLDEVSPSFCLAKSLQVTMYLHNGRTHSCHHPHTHPVPRHELINNPSALHNTQHKKQARREMLEGRRPAECDYCWRIEDSSKTSLSDRHFKSMDDWAEPFFEKVRDAPWDHNFDPSYVEVNFDSVCNMKCSYCGPDISSSWMDELKRLGPFQIYPHMTVENMILDERMPWKGSAKHNPYIQAFWKWWPKLYPALKVFRITGGEPLLSEETFRVLDYVARNGRSDLRVAINSNLMTPKRTIDRLIEKVRQITDANAVEQFMIYTSIDTWGEQGEYVRHGLRHDYFWNNVERVLRELPQVPLTFMCTFNALSVPRFSELLDHIYSLKQKHPRVLIDISFLRYPQHQSVQILPPEYLPTLERLVHKMESLRASAHAPGFSEYEIEKLRRVYLWMKVPESEAWLLERRKDFYLFFAEHDRRRGTDFLATFPEMREFWEACRALAGGEAR